jgi:Cytochrome P450
MYPEVQRKAQACIDAELGDEAGSRLPTWEDLEKLPYIAAILKEVGRWHSVLPFGLCPLHRTSWLVSHRNGSLPARLQRGRPLQRVSYPGKHCNSSQHMVRLDSSISQQFFDLL